MTKENICETSIVTRESLTKEEISSLYESNYFKHILYPFDKSLDAYQFPRDFLDFISHPKNRIHKIKDLTREDEASYPGPDLIVLNSPEELELIRIEIPATDPENEDDEESDEDGRYCGYGINLIKNASTYGPEGLLIWLPDFQVFGGFDPDHERLIVFPESNWQDVQKNIGTFLGANWDYTTVHYGEIYDFFDLSEKWEYEGED